LKTKCSQVSVQGLYNVGATCKDECEVWIRREKEPGLDDEGTTDELVIKLESLTSLKDHEA
jgi:hypothetical protein